MLKTTVGDQTWLISQPDHAAISGYLAAHWGSGEFAAPGYFAASFDAERLRAETVLGVAEHDNGWWEWEADPEIDPRDGLPLHLIDMSQRAGFANWRRGIARFEHSHPYVALLISLHAYRLVAPRVDKPLVAAHQHPLFGLPGSVARPRGEEWDEAVQFVAELGDGQRDLKERLRADRSWAAAVDAEHLDPHARLLQLGDALSLYLCLGAAGERSFDDVPRASLDDRVSLGLRPLDRRHITVRPYPFDRDPLPIVLPARVVDSSSRSRSLFQTWRHALPKQPLAFEFCSAG